MGGGPQTLITIRWLSSGTKEKITKRMTCNLRYNERAAPAEVIPRVDLPSNMKDKLTDFAFLPSKYNRYFMAYLSGTGICPMLT
jgi:hypothetical protein